MKIWKSTTMALFLGCTLLYLTGMSFAQDKEVERSYQVIRLLSNKIVPSVATIKLGTVVIWVNENSTPTEIRFANANDMVITCEGSKKSIEDPEKIIFEMIPCAGVKSLCLIQKGEFKYVVKRGYWEYEGKIIVE